MSYPYRTHRKNSNCKHRQGFGSILISWFMANTLISGALALLWLILRSGPKPSRFAYPCQQAAISTATLAFGAPLVALVIALRQKLAFWLRHKNWIAAAAIGMLATTSLWGVLSRASTPAPPEGDPPPGYRAEVFHVSDCPVDLEGDRFVGLDNLISVMGREGLKFYQSEVISPVAGPDGIVAPDDIVVIKINYQWPERGGTNTDLLRGLLHRIVNHPDLFEGEIIVCENAQFNSVSNFDRSTNNAENIMQSPHDVVVMFQNQGFNVSHYDWTARRTTQVTEYDAGNMNDGYVVLPYDPQFGGRVSYPKFRSASGHYLSLREGIWDPGTSTYDRTRMKFINVPVLKSHHATYGATAAVKNYMGVVTTALSTNSHSAMGNGLLGSLIADIRLADLNLLDAIWINANPYDGPWTTYGGATRRDELVAGVDPVALDIWAVSNILIPAFVDNGYSPPWPYPSADPENPSSSFRNYLDNSMAYLLEAGYEVTNQKADIDVYSWNGAGDFNGDSDVDAEDYAEFVTCFSGPDVPVDPQCAWGDFDDDNDVDCADWLAFLEAWTDLDDPPGFDTCDFPAPVTAAGGGRYVSVGVAGTSDPAALLLSGDEPSVDCISQYVQEDGTLGDDPVYLADWGGITISGAAILPGTSYQIQADYGTPGDPILSAPVAVNTWAWGDVDNNSVANFGDVLLIVLGFQGNFDVVSMEAADLLPCVPNGIVNFEDVLAGVLAFQGEEYDYMNCAQPCP
ncbi:MAG: DUF362 domain-containing protein [Planctomycetota bacterium]